MYSMECCSHDHKPCHQPFFLSRELPHPFCHFKCVSPFICLSLNIFLSLFFSVHLSFIRLPLPFLSLPHSPVASHLAQPITRISLSSEGYHRVSSLNMTCDTKLRSTVSEELRRPSKDAAFLSGNIFTKIKY